MEKENQDYITNPFSEKKRSNFKKKNQNFELEMSLHLGNEYSPWK